MSSFGVTFVLVLVHYALSLPVFLRVASVVSVESRLPGLLMFFFLSSCIRNSFKDGYFGFNCSGSKGRLVRSLLPIRSSAGESLHHGKGVDQ